MRYRIKINKIHIRMCVLIWISLSVLFLFLSVSPTEAGNSTNNKGDPEVSLVQEFSVKISVNNVEKDGTSSEQVIKVKDSADSPEDTASDSGQKTGTDSGTKTSERDNAGQQEKTTETNELKSQESSATDPSKEKVSNNSPNVPKSSSEDLESESGKNSDIKSSEDGLITGQNTLEKSSTEILENTGVVQKQKDDAEISETEASKAEESETEISKEIKSLVAEYVKVKPTGETGETCRTKDLNSGEVKLAVKSSSKSDGAACKQEKEVICITRNAMPIYLAENPQKTCTDTGTGSMDSGSSESNSGSGSSPNGTDPGSNSNGTGSDFNSGGADSDFNSRNQDSGLFSGLTDSDSHSGGTGYGSARIIRNEAVSTQGIESEKIIVDPAETLGIKGAMPQIEGNMAQASMIGGPSKFVSFIVGFAGTLFIMFTILRVRN